MLNPEGYTLQIDGNQIPEKDWSVEAYAQLFNAQPVCVVSTRHTLRRLNGVSCHFYLCRINANLRIEPISPHTGRITAMNKMAQLILNWCDGRATEQAISA